MKPLLMCFAGTLLMAGCSNAPTYDSPLKEVPQAEVGNYWIPKAPATERSTKIVAGKGMGCRAVHLEGGRRQSDDYIDIHYTIDSKGKQWDQSLVQIGGNVNEESIKWAMKFGLSPVSRFVQAEGNAQRVPIESVKRLYLLENSPLCDGKPHDIDFYSNQSISLSR